MDVTDLEFEPESVHAITAFGLFCTLIGPDAEMTANEILRILQFGGLLYLSDCLCFGGFYDYILQREISGPEVVALRQKWLRRYRENERLGLPEKTFLVFKKSHKDKEYGDADQLAEYWQDPLVFERFARHWDWDRLRALFGGLEWKYMAPQVFRSRTGAPLLGVSAIFKKIDPSIF